MNVLRTGTRAECRLALQAVLAVLSILTTSNLVAGEGEELETCDISRGERIYQKCAVCHNRDNSGEHHLAGPNLYKILGRPVGKVAGFKFSRKLRKSEDIWTAELMDVFLESPLEVYPGIRMAFAGLKKEKDRADLICYLEKHANEN